MASEDVGSLPILDGDQLIGVVTDRDIVIRAVATKKDPQGCQYAKSRLTILSRFVQTTISGRAEANGDLSGAPPSRRR